jgi:hypothetical protein
MFDHYSNFSGQYSSPHESRRCDVEHTSHLQDSVRQRMQPADRLTPIDQDFEPRDCRLGPFDAEALLSSIGVNNTLWYVGDSVTAQMFFSTGCLLEAAGSGPRWAEDEWNRLGTIPEEAHATEETSNGFQNGIHGRAQATSAVDALYRKCLLVAYPAGGGDVRMCAVFVSPKELLQTYPGLLQRVAGRPHDTVVMNFGVRLRPTHVLCGGADVSWCSALTSGVGSAGGLSCTTATDTSSWCRT